MGSSFPEAATQAILSWHMELLELVDLHWSAAPDRTVAGDRLLLTPAITTSASYWPVALICCCSISTLQAACFLPFDCGVQLAGTIKIRLYRGSSRKRTSSCCSAVSRASKRPPSRLCLQDARKKSSAGSRLQEPRALTQMQSQNLPWLWNQTALSLQTAEALKETLSCFKQLSQLGLERLLLQPSIDWLPSL